MIDLEHWPEIISRAAQSRAGLLRSRYFSSAPQSGFCSVEVLIRRGFELSRSQ